MAYPTDSAIKTELLINGVWTDVSTRVRGEDKVSITRGRLNEQSRVTAQFCQLTLNNRDGLFSNSNPLSAYYGLLPVGTQIRVAAGTGDNYLKTIFNDLELAYGPTSIASTPDIAALDIVGDIDIRMDVWPDTWRPREVMVVAAKWDLTTVNQRTWAFIIDPRGRLYFTWTPDGTFASSRAAVSTSVIPASTGRLSIRVQLDVDNGAGGCVVSFATAPTLTGTYTALSSSTSAGTTSIFSSTSDVGIGGATGPHPAIFSNSCNYGGKIFGVEIRNSAATVVANPDFSARTVGDTTWADGTGKVWTVQAGARITSDRVRFVGEVSRFPQVWDKTGRDVYVPIGAAGQIQRLTQGAKDLVSPMYRNFSQYSPNGWWPLADGAASLAVGSAVAGGLPAVPTNITFAADASLPGEPMTIGFNDSTSRIVFTAAPTTATTTSSFVLYMKTTALPAAGTPGFLVLYGTGLVARMDVGFSPTAWVFNCYDASHTLLLSQTVAVLSVTPVNLWVGFNIFLDTSGGNVRLTVRFDVVGISSGGFVGPTVVGAGTNVGYWRAGYMVAGDVAYENAKFSHLYMSTGNFDLTQGTFASASNGWYGETAMNRAARLALESDVTIEITGVAADSEIMGYQPVGSLMDLLYDCADADQGILGESRDSLAFTYRTRIDLENRTNLAIPYHSSLLSAAPIPQQDDTGLVNDATVSTNAGTFARSIVTTGPKSTQQPPNGVGVYASSPTKNVSATRISSIAAWVTFLGTWPADRYPQIAIALHRRQITSNATTFAQVASLNLGDTAILSGLPAWMPPDDVPLLVQGYTEVLEKFLWEVVYNTTPAGPYRMAILDSDDFVARVDAGASTLAAAATSTATTFSIATPAGNVWVTTAANPAEFPFSTKVTGETQSVTAITGATTPQSATVTRSSNGIVKAQSSGATISLAQPAYVAL